MVSRSALVATLALALLDGANAKVKKFSVTCDPLTIFRGDPIVTPGVLSYHVHVVTGGTAFALTESNEQARNSKNTTCDKILDKSGYWQPQLYHQRKDGKFELVKMTSQDAHYTAASCDYAPGRKSCVGAPHAKGPPRGINMVSGNPFRRTYNASDPEHRAQSHVCLSGKNKGNTKEITKLPCNRLSAETTFASCWDGKNLDSKSHKDHVSFPAIGDYDGGVCPETHPYAFLTLHYQFFYDTGAIKNPNRLAWSCGDATGYGLHADYLHGWTDQDRLEHAIDTCTGPKGVNDPKCSLNVGPDGTPGHPSHQELEIPPPTEDVGLQHPIDKLPGDNPV